MNTVKVKVIGYDDESSSLIVSFASDTTQSSNPDDYGSYAYQPQLMWPDANTNEEIMQQLARAGVTVCEEIVINETLAANTAKVENLKSLVNTEQQFNVSDLDVPVYTNDIIEPGLVEI